MDWTWLTWLLFSFKGRIQRLYWWIGSLVVGVVTGMASSTIEFLARSYGLGVVDADTNQFEPTGVLGALLVAIGILNVWINYALSAKRLHDRNRSGWWLVAPTVTLLVAILLALVMFAQPEGQRQPWNSAAVIFTLATAALGGWLFLEIGFLRGTEGPNRYGADPLTGQSPAP
jgi:uncharacterized membrane protein YhaH (DUF805 family)